VIGSRGPGGAAAIVVALCLIAPSVADGSITRRDAPAGDAVARGVLLRRADFGNGWSSAPGPRSVPPLTCSRFSPPIRAAVTEVGDAVSPTFRQSSSGPFVSQLAYVYASGAQRAQVWRAVVQPRLVRCVAESLSAGSGHGVRFRVTGKRLLRLPRLGVAAAGYRASGEAISQGQAIDVFLDMLVLGSGRTITAISISSFEQPAARAVELRLARAVASRG
jgi:hypothetical protein